MKPPALQARNVAVGYRARNTTKFVLRDVSVTVALGEMVCLLGPNGAGKSSFLRTVAGIQTPLAGAIELGAEPLERLGAMELARRVGVVLTERVEIGALPGYRVVELGRYPHLNWAGGLSEIDHEIVQWAMECVHVEHLATHDMNKMSDGERQRIMIARALAQDPMLLILDEPTAFLDVASRVELMGLLRRLAHEEDLAVVLSTHDLELALRTADTIWLADGRGRLLVGAPEDMVAAGLLGSVFESENVRFLPQDRAFRLVTGQRGKAAVEGEGLAAMLACAVLERQGYAIVKNGGARLLVRVGGNSVWEAAVDETRAQGSTFAELARFVRRTSM
jgi:iron complex transport system ATP-binding protein